jgi:hypothetical protein
VSAKDLSALLGIENLENKSMKAWWSQKLLQNRKNVSIVRTHLIKTKKYFSAHIVQNASVKIAWATRFHTIFKN